MIEKDLLCANRMRKITGSFAFIEHRFLRDGFWASLSHHELLVYFFLVIVIVEVFHITAMIKSASFVESLLMSISLQGIC
jgi:hypothetical protein